MSIEKIPITLGTDPEFFAMSNRKVLPAFEFLPSNREALPFPVIDSHYARANTVRAFWDGFQTEFELLRPFSCIVEMTHAIRGGMKELYLAARKLDPKSRLVINNVIKMTPEMQNDTPDEFLAFGCSPSYNVYGKEGEKVHDPRALVYRFSGGHLHGGIPIRFKSWDLERTVKILDRFLGIWSVGAAAKIDNPIRRKFYGLAGEHRKPARVISSYEYERYSVDRLEYRTLSNFWLCHPAILAATMELFRQGMRMGVDDKYLTMWDISDEAVQDIINTCDVKAAREFLKAHKSQYLDILNDAGIAGHTPVVGEYTKTKEAIWNIGYDGVHKFIPSYKNIARNWKLDVSYEKWSFKGDYPKSGIHMMSGASSGESSGF